MSPVRPLPPAPRRSDAPTSPGHFYTLLLFDEQLTTPWAVTIEAKDDAAAMSLARGLHASKRRELWCNHRLVGSF